MIQSGRFEHDQTILAYFTRPDRTVNHGRIKEIHWAMAGPPMPKAAEKYQHQPIANNEELENFLSGYPETDPRTGLHLVHDELLIKSREAMLLAVQAFNNPTMYFKAEIFIVSSVISWTYLLHFYFKRKGIDYVYQKNGQPDLTPHGQPRHYELAKCLKIEVCPLEAGEKRNLEYLLGLRHEIEHRMTTRIDDAIGAKLQACCLNFNTAIKRLFGRRCGFDRELSIALQFARVSVGQRAITVLHKELPSHIASYNTAFDESLSEEELNDPSYAYRVTLVPRTINNPRKADEIFEIVPQGSVEADKINTVLRDREPNKYLPSHIVQKMGELDFKKFTMHHHTALWKKLAAKAPKKRFGTNIAGTWYWYDQWLEEVRKHCEAEGARYR